MLLILLQLAVATNPRTANATGATNATGIITKSYWNPGQEPDMTFGTPIGGEEIQQLSPENIQFQQTDPAFAKLAQTTVTASMTIMRYLQR